MDLSKMKNDKKLYLCRWYYRAGFAFLPFLWCVNAIWFFSEAFRKPPYEQQKEIKKLLTFLSHKTEPQTQSWNILAILICALITDVVMSGIGAIVWIAVLTTWITIFQLHRAEWGATADRISFIIPTGIP